MSRRAPCCFTGPMTHLIRLLALFLPLWLALPVAAQQLPAPAPILLTDDSGTFWQHITPAAQALVEPICCLSPTEAAASTEWSAQATETLHPDRLRPAGNAAAIWVRFSVRNTLDRHGRWLIDTRTSRFRGVSIWQTTQGAPQPLLSLDLSSPFTARPVPHRHVMTDLTLAPGETTTILMRLDPLQSAPIDLRIAAFDPVWASESSKFLWSGIFYGSMLGVIVFVLMSMPLIGRAISFAFAGLMLSGLLWSLAESGALHQLGLVDNQFTALRLAYVFLHLTYAGGLTLLLLMFRLDRWTTPVRANLAFQAATALLCLLLPRLTTIDLLSQTAFAASLATFILTSLHAIRSRQGGGWPILTGALLIASVSLTLRIAFDNTPPGMEAHEVNRSLLSIFAMAFGFALIGRVAEIRKARDRAIRAELAASTEKLRLSRELRDRERAYDRFRRDAKRRQTHYATLGHDLVQPLAALRTAVSRDGALDDTRRDHLRQAIDYLQSVASGLRDTVPDSDPDPVPDSGDRHAAHLPAPDADGHEVLPAATVLDNVHAMFEDEVTAKGLTFRYTRSDTPIKGDPVLLIRSLSNLIVNALRHTDSGELHLFARATPDGTTAIGLTDTGSGMSPGDAARYLEPGQKGPDSPGQGLGLTSVARAAESMNATLTVDTAPGKGTTITLTFPPARRHT